MAYLDKITVGSTTYDIQDSNLKSAFVNFAENEEYRIDSESYNFTVGGYIYISNGTVLNDSTLAYTDYIELPSSFDRLRVHTNIPTDASGLAFYDAEYQFISGNNQAVDGAARNVFTDLYITIPSNAKYVRFTAYIYGKSLAFISVYNSIKQAERIDQIDKKLNDAISLPHVNLIDKSTVQVDAIDLNGSIEPFTGYCVTDYIRVFKNITYCLSQSLNSPGGLYDMEKTYVGKPYTGIFGNYATFTSPIDGYVRLNFLTAKYKSNIPNDYYFGVGAEIKAIKPIELLTDRIKVNLINKETMMANKIIDSSGDLIDFNNYYVTDYIRIYKGVTYSIGVELSTPGGLYDLDKNYVSQMYTGGRSGSFHSYTAPIDGYVRVNFGSNTYNNSLYFGIGSDLGSVGPGKISIPDLQEIENTGNIWQGKKLCCIGDSITDDDAWVTKLGNLLGTVTFNRGLSGSTLTYVGNGTGIVERADAVATDVATHSAGFPTAADLVIVFCGMNDFGKNMEFGEINGSVNKENFCGALHYLFRNLQNRYPNAKIYSVITYRVYSPELFPDFREIVYEDDDETKAFSYRTNSKGKTFDDYRNAIRLISSMYGIEIIDLLNVGFSFWNTHDRNLYSLEQTRSGITAHDGLHPSELGGDRMATYFYKCITSKVT